MSLEGSWEFKVEHGGVEYRVKVDDDRVRVETDDCADLRAKWSGDGLEDWTSYAWEGEFLQLPDDVMIEIESHVRAMAEAVDP